MTESTDRAISAAESLKFVIEKTKRYDDLWQAAAEIISLILIVSAILLAALLLILNYDFDNLVTDLGTFRLSPGYNLDIFNILGIIADITLFVYVYRTSKVIKKKNEVSNTVSFEHRDIKDLVKFIVGQDWDSLLKNISRGKSGFSFYTGTVILVYAFMIYLILLFFVPIFLVLLIRLLAVDLNAFHFYPLVIIIVSLILAFIVKHREIKESWNEINDMKNTLKQLRWFAERFQESAVQA
jgi:hypothetical protein